jgi:hypothetical protein
MFSVQCMLRSKSRILWMWTMSTSVVTKPRSSRKVLVATDDGGNRYFICRKTGETTVIPVVK